jgi:predicted secreted protein
MQRYHILRVVILTSILSIVVIHFFLVFGQTFGIGKQFDCVPDGIHFSETEM